VPPTPAAGPLAAAMLDVLHSLRRFCLTTKDGSRRRCPVGADMRNCACAAASVSVVNSEAVVKQSKADRVGAG
jgi:hypothetical protein